jgi:hypothetical protein
MGGGKTTTTTTVTQTAEEKEYTRQQIELAKQQLQLLEEQHGWQSEIYAMTKPLLEKYALLIEQDFADANDPATIALRDKQRQLDALNIDAAINNVPIQQELLQRQLDEIRRGGAATDEQKALIAEVTNRAIESGDTDIARFMASGIDQIRNEMAPARGMRPDDAPMIDAAQRVLEEATRQKGQLTSNLRGAQAQAELNFPLNAGQITNQWNQWQQGFGAQQSEFLSQLGQTAKANRTQLMGQLFTAPMTASEMGMNLIGAARPNPVDFPRNTTQTTKQSSNILGGIGGLLSGIGSLGGSGGIFSSKKAKTNIKPLEAPPGHMLSPGALKENFNVISGAGKPQVLGPQTQPGPFGKGTPTGPQVQPGVGGFGGTAINPVQSGAVNPPRTDEDVLDRLGRLPVSTWNYKPETGLPGTTHVGPMAEDFNTIMMGKQPEPFINTVDAVGSLMASVKALDKRTRGLGLANGRRKQAAPTGAGQWPRG